MKRTFTRVGHDLVHSLHAGSGANVLMLHGLAGSNAWWQYTIPSLAEHFSVHAPDLVGFGRSRGVRGKSIARTAEAVVKWCQRVGITQPAIIGHSMGGQIALHIAAQHPEFVRKLVLVSAAGIPHKISLIDAARFLAEIMPPRTWGTPRFLPRVALDTMRAGPFSFARATANILRDDVRPLLSKIRAPVLLTWGTLDALTPLRDAEYMAAHIPGARLVVFEDAAHMPMVDQPARFNAEVIAFLQA